VVPGFPSGAGHRLYGLLVFLRTQTKNTGRRIFGPTLVGKLAI
jgi:hypothetical protein